MMQSEFGRQTLLQWLTRQKPPEKPQNCPGLHYRRPILETVPKL